MKPVPVRAALIIGANSTIAQALQAAVLAKSEFGALITISRQAVAPEDPRHIALKCDNSEASIAQCLASIDDTVSIEAVFICNGILHQKDQPRGAIKPEKRLEEIHAEQMQAVFNANTITPMLWLKHLVKVIAKHTNSTLVVFSARVGSIQDNHLGGWYSYRASKAALNMLVKTAAIEYARRNKYVKLIAFHPGTTDTPLSQPFQANLGNKPLFTPDFVAQRLLQLIPNYAPDGQASFIDWQGKNIDW